MYLPFSDYFGTNRTSVWLYFINNEWAFWFDLIRFQKDFSVCKLIVTGDYFGQPFTRDRAANFVLDTSLFFPFLLQQVVKWCQAGRKTATRRTAVWEWEILVSFGIMRCPNWGDGVFRGPSHHEFSLELKGLRGGRALIGPPLWGSSLCFAGRKWCVYLFSWRFTAEPRNSAATFCVEAGPIWGHFPPGGFWEINVSNARQINV